MTVSDSNAFYGFGKYDTGSEDETDIRPGPPSCFRTGKIRFILKSAVIFRNHKIR